MINTDAITARVVHVDSRTRHQGRAEECRISLPEPISLPKGVICTCTQISLPLSWHNVCAFNNLFYLTLRSKTFPSLRCREFIANANRLERAPTAALLV